VNQLIFKSLNMKNYYWILLLIFLTGCSSTGLYITDEAGGWEDNQPPRSEDLLYRIFAIGDAGSPASEKKEPTLRLLQSKLEDADENSALVTVGDNLYPDGMPEPDSPGRAEAERRITEQLEITRGFRGRVILTPGNHDWGAGGVEGLRRQERFVENFLNRGNTFLPDNGFPGPHDVKLLDSDNHPQLQKDIHLIVMDTQWWFESDDKPFGDTGKYELSNENDFLNELENVLKKRQNDHLIVLGHHPLFSNGNHGGRFPLKTHLLPPVGGSFYVIYRKIFGLEQDIASSRYSKLKNELLKRFRNHNNLIYAAGHEHNLQYIRKEQDTTRQNYIISGAGSKRDYTAPGKEAYFASDRKGFAVISYYSDGSSWVEFWSPEKEGEEGKLLFRTQLGGPYLHTPAQNGKKKTESKDKSPGVPAFSW